MIKSIAVIFGGVSPEHDISIVTALSSVIKPLIITKKYKVIPVYISKDGQWYSDNSFFDIATFQSDKIKVKLAKLKPLQLEIGGGLRFIQPGIRSKVIDIDVVFPALHGENGEDGSLAGLLRMANVPFVGCDMQAGVIAMDKVLAKQVAILHNVPTAKFETVYGYSYNADTKIRIVEQLMNSLKFPLFVKPAHLGSSIGISRVENQTDLLQAIDLALTFDHKVIVEEGVSNLIEVTVPVIGNTSTQTALVERPLLGTDGVFDFETKYLQGNKKQGGAKVSAKTSGSQGYSELPAKIPPGLYEKSIEVAQEMFKATECSGTARIDLLIDSKQETVYFNEINPLPGSLYAHNWRASGVSAIDLVNRLIDLAEERFSDQAKRKTTFDTNFLQQF
jgi:D-alanine-D-alanine ligase